jgi:hypothetical protein
MWFRGRRLWAALGLAGVGMVASGASRAAAAGGPPDFSGSWTINRSLSDDVAARVGEVAGPDLVAGAHTFGGITFLPRSSYGKDVDRVSLRQLLLDSVAALDHLEIEQSPDEIKLMQGEDGVRLFYLKRDSTGSAIDGAKLTRRMRFEGEQLRLESESGKKRTIELLTLVPARSQLIHAIHYEHELLKKPLELKLVYDRTAKAR